MILYTIGCPQCNVLEKKLAIKGISYERCEDRDKMNELGIRFAPALQLEDGSILNFAQANKWINEGGK